MMELLDSDFTDKAYTDVQDIPRAEYLALGNQAFESQCLKSGVTFADIPTDPRPYIGVRLGVVLTMIILLTDKVGSDYREVTGAVPIDVYKSKLDTYELEKQRLLADFTDEMLGIEPNDGSTSNVSVRFARG